MSSIENIRLRLPVLEDGKAVYQLIESCPPLDMNSRYCNLLQCSHFASTSVAAEVEGNLVGFISGYIVPENTDTLFIWQVAVSGQARGVGLASRMLLHILARSHCKNISLLETTITPDNQASWALFRSLAEKLSADFYSSIWMDKEAHFDGQHEPEMLVRIGPFNNNTRERS